MRGLDKLRTKKETPVVMLTVPTAPRRIYSARPAGNTKSGFLCYFPKSFFLFAFFVLFLAIPFFSVFLAFSTLRSKFFISFLGVTP